MDDLAITDRNPFEKINQLLDRPGIGSAQLPRQGIAKSFNASRLPPWRPCRAALPGPPCLELDELGGSIVS
jgi:hypothetical protein